MSRGSSPSGARHSALRNEAGANLSVPRSWLRMTSCEMNTPTVSTFIRIGLSRHSLPTCCLPLSEISSAPSLLGKAIHRKRLTKCFVHTFQPPEMRGTQTYRKHKKPRRCFGVPGGAISLAGPEAR